MSRTVVSRVLALSAACGRAEAPVTARSAFQCLQRQPFSHTSRRRADDEKKAPTTTPSKTSSLPDTASSRFGLSSDNLSSSPAERASLSSLSSIFEEGQASKPKRFSGASNLSVMGGVIPHERYEEPHHIHVYATKHNTHITVTRPNRDPVISMSTGNIGFKKSNRKHYDSAFQLAGYVFGRMNDTGLNPQIKKIEVCLRGFGKGREAVTKAILGYEGRFLRDKIVRVTDATRLKFGGTRSPKPRRLG